MNCIFCKIVANEADAKKIYEDDQVIAILDAYPEVDGHILIIPKNHYSDIYELPEDVFLHINKVAKELNKKLLEKLEVNSSMIAYNYGDRQFVKHFHLHILPNYGKNIPSKNIDEIYELLN